MQALTDLATTAYPDDGADTLANTSPKTLGLDASREPELAALLQLRRAAFAYDKVGDWQTAASLADEAAAAYAAINNPAGELAARELKGASLIELANTGESDRRRETLREAIAILTECLHGYTTADLEYEAAHAENNIGLARHHLGESDEAVSHFEAAAKRFEAAGSRVSQAMALQNIAWVRLEQGHYRLARTLYERPLSIYAQLGETNIHRAVLNNSALAHSVTGETEQAVVLYRQSLALQEDSPDVAERARALHGIGAAYLRAGRPTRALDYFLEALPFREQANDGRGLATTLIALGNTYRILDDLPNALVHHERAAALKLGALERAKALYALALDLEATGRAAQALEALNSTLELTLPPDVEIRGLALTARGRLHAAAGRRTHALADLDEAAHILQTSGAVAYEADTLVERARIFRARGDDDLALQELEQAARTVEAIRLKAANPELRNAIRASRAAVFDELIDVMMTSARQTTNDPASARSWQLRALEARERWQARSLIERLELADVPSETPQDDALARHYEDLAGAKYRLDQLRDRSKPDPARIGLVEERISAIRREIDALEAARGLASTPVDVAPVLTRGDLQNLRTTLEPGTALLVYSVGSERSWMWVLSRAGIDSYRLPGRARLRKAVDQFRACLDEPSDAFIASDDACTENGGTLAAWLLPEPLRAGGFSRLRVALDGPLLRLPFAALPIRDATDVRSAIQRWDLVQTPSLALFLQKRRQSAGRPGGDLRVAVINAPRVQPPQPEGSWPIVFTSASEAPWRGHDVIHFGTHAYADLEDPGLSALEIPTAGTESEAGTRPLYLRDIYRLRLDAALVVLAACETGVGQILPGEGSMSLAHGFMSAGAHSVMASLWRIGDAATRDLVAHFYRKLAEGADPAAALASAQREALAGKRWKHPYFWAGLVVYE